MNYNVELTFERAKKLFYIDESDILRWQVRKANRIHIGDIAGSVNSKGRRYVEIEGTQYLVHRIIWLIKYGVWPISQIDHKNRDPGNNGIRNLREASARQNTYNQKHHKNNKLGIKGVCYNKASKKYVSQIRLGDDIGVFFIGYFNTPEEAGWAYEFAAKALHGVFYYKSEET